MSDSCKITSGPTVVQECDRLNYGYYADAEQTAEFDSRLKHATFGDTPTFRKYRNDFRDIKETRPWEPLLEFFPSWKRGAQGIGDCVSWGWALAILLVMCRLAKQGKIDPSVLRDVATEAIYGGSRVEARGGKLGGYSDGSYGAAAARFVTQWGFVLREDYSDETSVEEHDLRRYSAKKAKAWGNFGCGGKQDAGRGDGLLDKLAKDLKVEVVPVKTEEQAWVAQQQGFALAVCSTVGFGSETRNRDGVVGASGRWAHCMAKAGIRELRGRHHHRQWQSWGASAEGPDPGIESDRLSECSYWTTENDSDRQFRANDTYAVSVVDGFDEPIFDISNLAAGDFD